MTETELRRRRAALNLSLQEVAERVGVSVSSLSLIERGKRRASPRLWRRLSQELELSSAASPSPSMQALDGDSVHARLRHAIVHGELRPNQRLIEARLADTYGVSRTPIRETLQRLAAEGLVEHRIKGWRVHEHTASEITDIYELRAALEGYAARLAAARADGGEREEILRRASNRLSPAGDPSSRVLTNEAFHDSIVAAARNSRLAEAVGESRQYYFNHRLVLAYGAADTEQAYREHAAIARAIAARDGRRAELLSRTHVAHALEIVLRHTQL